MRTPRHNCTVTQPQRRQRTDEEIFTRWNNTIGASTCPLPEQETERTSCLKKQLESKNKRAKLQHQKQWNSLHGDSVTE